MQAGYFRVASYSVKSLTHAVAAACFDLDSPALNCSFYLRPSFWPAASNLIDSRIRFTRVCGRLAV